jgi:hypothetical protein
MNERIRELAEQAGFVDKGSNHTAYMSFDHEKFAELIVKECIQVSKAHAKSLEAQPCETEFAEYENGVVEGIYEATAAIKEHFGVEE